MNFFLHFFIPDNTYSDISFFHVFIQKYCHQNIYLTYPFKLFWVFYNLLILNEFSCWRYCWWVVGNTSNMAEYGWHRGSKVQKYGHKNKYDHNLLIVAIFMKIWPYFARIMVIFLLLRKLVIFLLLVNGILRPYFLVAIFPNEI